MISIDETLDVAATPDAVFSVLTRVQRYPAWIPGVLSAEPLPGVAEGTTGSRVRLRLNGPMGAIDAAAEVVEARPPEALQARASSGLFALGATCSVEGAGAGSRLRVVAELELKGLARFAEGQVRGQVASGMPAALAQLRTAIETESSRAG